MITWSHGRVYVGVYAAELTAGVRSRQDRENLAITVTVVGYRAVAATSGRSRNLDEEAGRCGIVHGEKEQGRVFTICNQRWWSACLACVANCKRWTVRTLGR